MRVICVTIKQSYNRGKAPRVPTRTRSPTRDSLQAVCLRTRTRRLTRPMARSCYILADSDYDCGQRLSLERREPCANAQPVREAKIASGDSEWGHHHTWPGTTYQALAAYRLNSALFRRSVGPWPAGIEPVEPFRFKSDLRDHQAIAQPRLCDFLMVTQITLENR